MYPILPPVTNYSEWKQLQKIFMTCHCNVIYTVYLIKCLAKHAVQVH